MNFSIYAPYRQKAAIMTGYLTIVNKWRYENEILIAKSPKSKHYKINSIYSIGYFFILTNFFDVFKP